LRHRPPVPAYLVLLAWLLLRLAASPLCADGRPAPAPAVEPAIVTLDTAVLLALRRSPTAARARQERAAAQAAAQREAPRLDPIISLLGSGLLNGPRITFPRPDEGDAAVVPRSRLRLDLAAEMALFRPGGASAEQRFRAASRAAEADYARTLSDLRRDVKHAYFALLTADAAVAVAREGAEQARAHRRLVDDLVTTGRATRLDQLQGDVEVEESAGAAADAEEGRDLAAAALNRMLGRPLAESITVAPAKEPGPTLGEGEALALIDRRPDVMALAARVEAAEAGARLARLQSAPGLSLSTSYALQTPSAFIARSSWAAGLTVTWPLGMGMRAKSDAREAAAHAGAARAALTELREAAALEVRQSLYAVRSARRRRAAAQRTAAAAEEALRITELRFQAGRATGLEVTAARAALNRARLEGFRALYDWHTGLADLERATGAALPVLGVAQS
jgi:outer membrane protein